MIQNYSATPSYTSVLSRNYKNSKFPVKCAVFTMHGSGCGAYGCPFYNILSDTHQGFAWVCGWNSWLSATAGV